MPEPTVFVVMPFSQGTEDLWEIGIRETVRSLKWQCVRADQLASPGFIVSQVYDWIEKADVVIGVMTGKNPNVFYEIGYAHSLGKPTLLLAAHQEDLTVFNTQGFRHFVYEGRIAKVRQILKEVLPSIHDESHPWPKFPAGEILYEWPSDDFDPPNLEWKSGDAQKDKQIDLNGGQTITDVHPAGKALCVRNTAKYWNWKPGRSIIGLLKPTNRLKRGATVHLIICGRVEGEAHLRFSADGGYVNPAKKETWVSPFCVEQKERNLTWRTWIISATVVAPEAYDLVKRGASVYLVNDVGRGFAWYKRIQIIQVLSPK